MAKKRNRTKSQRDVFTIANDPLLRLPAVSPRTPLNTVLQSYEDRRTWTPDPYSARTFSKVGHLLGGDVSQKISKKTGRPTAFHRLQVSFSEPNRVLVCVRRQKRREVLFAHRRTGKGARAPRRRNYFSNISCRA